MRPPRARTRQRGVAIITALLLTTLAITIVASLFWQQQVQVRSMENQRQHLQTKWIVRGGLDMARFLLHQDGIGPNHGRQTTLDGVWATPLAETRLDQYVERERVEGENFDATLAGQISDAQSRYNLTNLAAGPGQVTAFARLLTNLQLDPNLAQAAARVLAPPSAPPASPASGQVKRTSGEPIGLVQVEDLLAVPGFTPRALERLRSFVTVLPRATPVNVNTASPEVLAAVVECSVGEASALTLHRQRKYLDTAAFIADLGGKKPVDGVELDVKTSYFLVSSQVRLDRAALDAQALIERDSNSMATTLIWIREN